MIVVGDWVVPISGPPVAGGAVLVRGGKIADVGSVAELRVRHPDEEVRECPSCVVLPGFINAHTHLDYSAFQGFSSYRGFLRWIIRLTKARMKLDQEDLAVSALWGAHECLRHGVTSIADTSYGGSTVARAAAATGLRARVYLEVFGLDDTRLAETMARLESALGEAQVGTAAQAGHAGPGAQSTTVAQSTTAGDGGGSGERVEWGVSPHAPYTVSQALYAEVAQMVRRSGQRMATHVAESKTEVRLLRRYSMLARVTYGMLASMTGGRWRLPRIRPVRYVAEAGALGEDMLVVHAVQVDDEDIELIASSGAAVAHCPRSNAILDCGIAPVAVMKAAGITVGLGTDSLASNDSLDMLAEMRAALAASRELAARQIDGMALTPTEVLRMATLDGARALGWEQSTGSLEPGKEADLAVVRLARGVSRTASCDELSSAIMDGKVVMTLVSGRLLYQGEGVPRSVAADMQKVRAKLSLRD